MKPDYMLSFYVPEDSLDSVKSALFAKGAGKIGSYDSCCWQVKGRGQFRPLEGSVPSIGSLNQVESVTEWKVEIVLEKAILSEVIAALKASHPYETPAFQVIELVSV
ncbi:MAG TPA: NGG1p interacting factor NIF3 [Gammaproteobacteria bacterium]|nr:NGG1p interacting factor NIF3 [Gammaproteobacteria bacterium]